MQNFLLFPWNFYFSFITLTYFSFNFFVITFAKVIEIHSR